VDVVELQRRTESRLSKSVTICLFTFTQLLSTNRYLCVLYIYDYVTCYAETAN